MEKIDLAVASRTDADQARYLRRDNMVPAVVYGRGFENKHLKIDYQTFRRVFEKATYSTIITLNVEGGDSVPVLVQHVDYDPVTDNIMHVDFHAVRMDEKVHTHIALEFVGESEAVRLGAVLSTNKHEVEVSCLPGDLVHNIEVDISALAEVGDTIRISDVVAPNGIEILDTPEEPVVSAIEPKVVEEEEPEAAEGEGEEGEEGGEAAAEGEGGGEGGGDAEEKKEE